MAYIKSLKLSPSSLDVMHVLVCAVHADHVVDGKEIKVIVDAVSALDILSDTGEALSDIDLLYWLEANYNKIAAQYAGAKRDIELMILLTRMARRDDLDVIMNVIMDIYHADGEYHEAEKDFGDIVRSYWTKLST